jgi:hypothetical protein
MRINQKNIEAYDCECEHEYDLCKVCERDLDNERSYWFSTHNTNFFGDE